MARLTEAGTLMRHIVDRVIDIARPDDVVAAPVLEHVRSRSIDVPMTASRPGRRARHGAKACC